MPRLLQGLRKHQWLFIVAALVFVLDQVSKQWISDTLPAGAYYGNDDALAIIPDRLYIVHVFNPGAAWGMFSGYAMLLGVLGLLAIGLVFFFRKHLELNRPGLQGIFGLLCGGILGNLVDRIHYGHVVDFILVILPGGYQWPAFNIADIAISCGVGIYLIFTLRESFQKKNAE